MLGGRSGWVAWRKGSQLLTRPRCLQADPCLTALSGCGAGELCPPGLKPVEQPLPGSPAARKPLAPSGHSQHLRLLPPAAQESSNHPPSLLQLSAAFYSSGLSFHVYLGEQQVGRIWERTGRPGYLGLEWGQEAGHGGPGGGRKEGDPISPLQRRGEVQSPHGGSRGTQF